jgi:hypothetical protein
MNSFAPIDTVKIANTIISSVDFSPKFGVLGLGASDGRLLYYDSKSLAKCGEKAIAEITVKSVSFKNDILIAGTADNAMTMNKIIRGNSISFTFLLKLLISILIILYIINKKNNIL